MSLGSRSTISATCAAMILAGCASRTPSGPSTQGRSSESREAAAVYSPRPYHLTPSAYALEEPLRFYGVRACPQDCLAPTQKTLVTDPVDAASSVKTLAIRLPVALATPLPKRNIETVALAPTDAPALVSSAASSLAPLLIAHRPGRAAVDGQAHEAVVALARQFKVMNGSGTAKLLVVGHADAMGSAASNERIAVRRALNIKQLLLKAGLPDGAVIVRAAPFEYLHSNSTTEGRTLNRQTFIRLI